MTHQSPSKTAKVAEIISSNYKGKIERVLVVGCGDGTEAAVLAEKFAAEVIGIDTKDEFDADAARIADLRKGDAMALEFENETFDLVYSYHALEHISRPHVALKEIGRVLRSGGGVWIGTPNRSRILGYIGSSDADLWQKIEWNFADWRARLSGRFKNELGAHAGFTSNELRSMLEENFDQVLDVSEKYFLTVYARFSRLIGLVESCGLGRFAFPSVYFIGRKPERVE